MRKTLFFQKPHLFFEVYLGLFLRNPRFLKTTKSRSEIASSFPAVARLDLSYVSENGGKRLSPNTHFQIFQQYQKKHSAYLYLANSVNHRGGAKQIITIFLTLLYTIWGRAINWYTPPQVVAKFTNT